MSTLLWIAGVVGVCLPVVRATWKRLTTFRVGITSKREDYSMLRSEHTCRVVVQRVCPPETVTVARVNLSADDADEKLIEAKVLAIDRCRSLNTIARSMR